MLAIHIPIVVMLELVETEKNNVMSPVAKAETIHISQLWFKMQMPRKTTTPIHE